jgi:hypothetical protein
MSAVARLLAAGSARRAKAEPAAGVPTAVAVLGEARVAAPVACAAALRLTSVAGADAALVVGPEPPVGPRAPARPRAARMAASLAARDIPAVATGRLVRATLPEEDGFVAFGRAAAVAGGPVVLMTGGVRTEAVDRALELQEAVIVVPSPGSDPEVPQLAVDGLRALGHRALTATNPADPLSRALALAGLAAIGSLRALADDLIDGDRR